MIRQGRSDEALPLIERLLAAEPSNGAHGVLKVAGLCKLAERHTEGLAKHHLSCLPIIRTTPSFRLLAGNQQRYIGQSTEGHQFVPARDRAFDPDTAWRIGRCRISRLSTSRPAEIEKTCAPARAWFAPVGPDATGPWNSPLARAAGRSRRICGGVLNIMGGGNRLGPPAHVSITTRKATSCIT